VNTHNIHIKLSSTSTTTATNNKQQISSAKRKKKQQHIKYKFYIIANTKNDASINSYQRWPDIHSLQRSALSRATTSTRWWETVYSRIAIDESGALFPLAS